MTRVLRTSIWALNALLITLCAYWTAGLLIAITRTALAGGTPALEAVAPVHTAARPTWQQRRVVLDRNLFQVSTLLPEVVEAEVPADADLDETKLPLTLMGTIASNVREVARASIRLDNDPKKKVVSVRVSEEVMDGATVSRIDRRRIVIDNRGNLEALSLDENDDTGVRQTVSRRAPARRAGAQNRRPAGRRTAVPTPPSAAEAAVLRDPSQIISQARFQPRYEEDKLVGIGVNAVRKGSLLEDIGMRNGDTIVELNGLNIEGGEDASELLREFQDLAEIEEFEVQVVGQDGSKRTLEYSYE